MTDLSPMPAPTDQQRRLVEEFGLFFEGQGGTRMAGRIAGWLLLCSPPVQSLSGLSEALGVSKGATSEAVRLLVQMGIIDRVSEPGRRGDCYRSRPEALDTLLHVDAAVAMRDLLDRALTTVTLGDPPQPNHLLLRDLRDFQSFLECELPALRERWEQTRGTTASTTDGPARPVHEEEPA